LPAVEGAAVDVDPVQRAVAAHGDEEALRRTRLFSRGARAEHRVRREGRNRDDLLEQGAAAIWRVQEGDGRAAAGGDGALARRLLAGGPTGRRLSVGYADEARGPAVVRGGAGRVLPHVADLARLTVRVARADPRHDLTETPEAHALDGATVELEIEVAVDHVQPLGALVDGEGDGEVELIGGRRDAIPRRNTRGEHRGRREPAAPEARGDAPATRCPGRRSRRERSRGPRRARRRNPRGGG